MCILESCPMKYKVVAAIDSLDPNPDVFMFDDHDEAADFIYDEVQRRINHEVEHSPYSIDEKELQDMLEVEMSLFTLSKTD